MKTAERVAIVEIGGRLTSRTGSVRLHLALLLVHAVHVVTGLLLLLLRMMVLSGVLLHVIDHLRLVGVSRRANLVVGHLALCVASALGAGRARLTAGTRAGRARAAGSGLGFDQS